MRARTAASVVLAATLLLGTTGCTFFSKIATQNPYEPSDGVGATIGDIAVRNAIVVTSDGTDANLIVAIINTGTSTAKVALQYEVDGAKVTEDVLVSGGETMSFGTAELGPLELGNVGVAAGDVLPIYVQYGTEPGTEILAPVLDGTLPEYADFAP